MRHLTGSKAGFCVRAGVGDGALPLLRGRQRHPVQDAGGSRTGRLFLCDECVSCLSIGRHLLGSLRHLQATSTVCPILCGE